MMYLSRSVLMISNWECRNPLVEEAKAGNERSKEIFHTRDMVMDKLIVLLKSKR